MSDEAFARRFYADRAELLALGVPLESQRDEFTGEELYTLLPEHYFLPPLDLTDDELAALADLPLPARGPVRLRRAAAARAPEPRARPAEPSTSAAPDEVSREAARQRLLGRDRRAAAEARDGDLEAAHDRVPLLGDLVRRGGRAHGRPVQPATCRAVSGTWSDATTTATTIRTFRARRASAATSASPRGASATSACRPSSTPSAYRDRAAVAARRDRGRGSRSIRSRPTPPGWSSAPFGRTDAASVEDGRLRSRPRSPTSGCSPRWMIGLDGRAVPLAPPELRRRGRTAALERVAADARGRGQPHAVAARAGRPRRRRARAAGRAPVAPERFARAAGDARRPARRAAATSKRARHPDRGRAGRALQLPRGSARGAPVSS